MCRNSQCLGNLLNFVVILKMIETIKCINELRNKKKVNKKIYFSEEVRFLPNDPCYDKFRKNF
jgi:hypothetical protein